MITRNLVSLKYIISYLIGHQSIFLIYYWDNSEFIKCRDIEILREILYFNEFAVTMLHVSAMPSCPLIRNRSANITRVYVIYQTGWRRRPLDARRPAAETATYLRHCVAG